MCKRDRKEDSPLNHANHTAAAPDAKTFRDLAARLIPALQDAGRAILRHAAGPLTVTCKDDNTPVTAADREAEEILLGALQAAAPNVPVIAEEAASAGHLPEPGGRFFLVDPLDGTREFIRGRKEYTINIGLAEAGRPVFGLIYAPALDALYLTLAPGEAAAARLCADAPAPRLADLTLTPLHTRAPAADGLVAITSRSHLNERTKAYLARYPVKDFARAGSSLKFCTLARGAADVYPRLGPTMEWDTAAGHAILCAAGGAVLTLDGTPLAYGKRDQGYANPHFVAWGRAEAAAIVS